MTNPTTIPDAGWMGDRSRGASMGRDEFDVEIGIEFGANTILAFVLDLPFQHIAVEKVIRLAVRRHRYGGADDFETCVAGG